MSDSGARSRGFETYRRRVVSLSKTLYSPKVLVNYPMKRWLRPDMTEKLLTGTLSLNTNKIFLFLFFPGLDIIPSGQSAHQWFSKSETLKDIGYRSSPQVYDVTLLLCKMQFSYPTAFCTDSRADLKDLSKINKNISIV